MGWGPAGTRNTLKQQKALVSYNIKRERLLKHLLTAEPEGIFRLVRLGAVSSLYGLTLWGCANLMSDPPVDVRVVRFDETPSENSDQPPGIPNADLVETKAIGFGHSTYNDSIDRWAKMFAYHNDADVVVVRPTRRRTLSREFRFEAWRTKGYKQKIQDDIPEPGSTLLPPPSTTYTTRYRNVDECVANARQSEFPSLTEEEKSFLSGRDTRAFVDFSGTPKIDDRQRPRQFGMETRALGPSVPKGATDRYVLCLMRRGYQWPQGGAAKK
jgi:hypothetical protein